MSEAYIKQYALACCTFDTAGTPKELTVLRPTVRQVKNSHREVQETLAFMQWQARRPILLGASRGMQMPPPTTMLCPTRTVPGHATVLCNDVVLTQKDKALTECFSCKKATKAVSGISAFAVGVAVSSVLLGAVTFGLGAAIVLGTVAAGAVATTASVVYANHACNQALSISDDWQKSHQSVEIDGYKAIVHNQSFLKCSKGGILVSPASSIEAIALAEAIAKNNNTEIAFNFAENLFNGLLTGGGAWYAITGAMIAVSLSESGVLESESQAYQDEAYSYTANIALGLLDEAKNVAERGVNIYKGFKASMFSYIFDDIVEESLQKENEAIASGFYASDY